MCWGLRNNWLLSTEYNITQSDESTLIDESNVCFVVRAMKQQMKASSYINGIPWYDGQWIHNSNFHYNVRINMNNVLKARCSHVKEWACVLRGQFVSKNSWLQIIVITSIGSWILMQDYSCCILNIIKILMDKLFMLRPQYWMERQGSHCWTSQL